MKVTLLKEGVRGDKGNLGRKELTNVVVPICSAVILLKGPKNIIVDTGNLGYESEIINKLHNSGLIPEQIDYVINTHRHFDHCSNNHLFRNAVRVSGSSVWYPIKKVETYIKLEDIKLPEIKLIPTPGHVQEHISVVVKARQTYVIAGDAIEEDRIRTNFYKDYPNKEQIIESIKKILDIADVIIPGHGPIIEKKTIEELKQIIAKWRIKNG